MKINVQRRFDHMIHHSSQHLITAVALNSYNRKTLSWNLAPKDKSCYVELSGELRVSNIFNLICLPPLTFELLIFNNVIGESKNRRKASIIMKKLESTYS